MTLALLAAFAPGARAQQAVHSATDSEPHSSFPAPVTLMVDGERLNAASVISPIRADYAYGIGITGSGVTIATMDSGINATHSEFTGRLMQGYNAITGSTDVSDGAGHGTHVAGILAGTRDGRGIFGVAYDARLLPIKVLDNNGNGSTNYLDSGLRYAIGRAAIANMSLGANGIYDPSAMKEAVNAGMLLVAAAGNDGAANPNWPARFAKEAWANNQIIAVGAVDSSNRITYYSNRAGDTAAWFLVAPGNNILSSYPNNGYAYMSGTSMATPIVSGAAALIKQRWPTLAADQIANILFLTATDLGDPGIDTVYGRGLLNIEKAMQPIGAITTTSYNGKSVNVLAGMIQVSSATSRVWQLAASGQLRVIGLDDFRRDFPVDLGATVSRPASLSLSQVWGSMDRRIDVAESVLANGAQLAVAYEHTLPTPGLSERAQAARLAAFALTTKSAGGTEAAFGVGGMAAQYFGAGGLDLGPEMKLGAMPALANPYFSLVPGASHTALAREVGGVKLKFGLLSSDTNTILSTQDMALPSSTLAAPRASAAMFELSKSFGDAALSLSYSRTREKNAYLGSQSNGALMLAPSATTGAVQLAAAVLLTPKLALAGQAAYGITPGSMSDGLVTEVTRARTNAFSLGLIAADNVKTGDRFSISVSQPMRAYAGELAMDMLTGVSNDGTPTRERLRFSMVPLGRELRGEMTYQMPAGAGASMGVTLMLRHEPNNLVDAAMEKLVAWRYVKSF